MRKAASRHGYPRFAARQLLAKQVRYTFKGGAAAHAAQSLLVAGRFEYRSPPQGGTQRGTRQKPVHVLVVDDGNRAIGQRLDDDRWLDVPQGVAMQIVEVAGMLEGEDAA